MKLISAVIRPKLLPKLASMLRKADVPGLTVIKAQGFGREHRAADVGQVGFLTDKTKVEVGVEDHQVDTVVRIIHEAGGTGRQGDGVIFVWDLVHSARIERPEEDEDED